MLIGGWTGLVLRRAAADRPLVAAAALVVVVASSVLVAAAGYPAAAARQGAVSRLLAADPLATAISVTFDVRTAAVADADDAVRAVLGGATGPLGGGIAASGRSESYDPGLSGAGHAPLTKFAFLDDLDRHAHLADGSWPTTGRPEIEAVITQPAADRLGIGVGRSIHVQSRLAPARRLAVRVVGIIAPDDRDDPAWGRDPLVLDGVVETGSFTTIGPLFVTRDDLLGRTIVTAATLTWRAFPDFSRLEVAAVPALAASTAAVHDRLAARIERAPTIDVETDLPAILREVDASLAQAVTGSGVVGGQLLALAVYALVFVAALVVQRRRGGALLLQSRGASAIDHLRLALLEAAVVAVPAAALGVPLGAVLIALLAAAALPAAGGAQGLQVTQPMLLAAAGTGLAAIAGLAAPAVASSASIARLRQSTAGRRAGAIVSRSGLDLALVALAVVALWQLRTAGAGRRGLDPVDLAAPAIGLVAGALLAIRLTPLAARLVEGATARGTAVTGALAGRGIARNAEASARSILLFVAATAIAVYCVQFDRTWTGSQRDQVAHDVAADVRGTVARGDAPPLREAALGLRSIPGVTGASPVIRDTFDAGSELPSGQLIAVPADPAIAAGAARSDLADRPLSSLLADLAAARPAMPVLRVPPSAASLRVTIDAELVQASGDPAIPAGWNGVAVAIVLQDEDGALTRLVAAGGGSGSGASFVVPLPTAADGAAAATGKLGILAVEVDVTPPGGPGVAGSVGVAGIEASAGAGADAGWVPLDLAPTRDAWAFTRTAFGTPAVPLADDPSRPGRAMIAMDDPITGLGATTLAFRPTALATLAAAPIAAVVDGRTLAATRSSIGASALVRYGFSGTRTLAIGGVVASFPGVPHAGVAVVDLGTLQAATYGADGTVPPAGEWWLTTDGRDDRAIADAVAAEPFRLADVRARQAETQSRLDDPVALGLFGTLGLAAVAAVAFAALGLAAGAWSAGRARRGEFAVLQALGLGRRELAGWIVAEQAFPIAAGLGGGILLGTILGAIVLPATIRAPDGTPPVPPVLVAVPWDLVAVIAAAGVLGVAGATLLLLRGIHAVGVAETLRAGTVGVDG